MIKKIFFNIFLGLFFLQFFFFSGFYGRVLCNSFLADIVSGVLVNLANRERVGLDATELKVSSELELAAQLKAEDMAKKGYFAHTSPEGITPWYWFSQAGYSFVYAGENLAVNFADSDQLHQAWVNSISHRKNIVNPNFTEIGIGQAEGFYKGKKAVFVVQLFGRPRTQEDLNSLSLKEEVPGTENGEVAGAQTIVIDSGKEEVVFEVIEQTGENNSSVVVKDAMIEDKEFSERGIASQDFCISK